MTGILIERGNWTQMCTQGEHQVKISVLLPQAKEHQRLLANHYQVGDKHETDSPSHPS